MLSANLLFYFFSGVLVFSAIMVDEKLIILTLFCTLLLSTILFLLLGFFFFNFKPTSLAHVDKYNYFLPDLALLLRVNSLGNKIFCLGEVTRTYKALSWCYILLMYFLMKDRTICIILHLVNYSYIALSLGVKVRREIMKFARNGAPSQLGIKPISKVYNNINFMQYAYTIFSDKFMLDRDMLVGFNNPRVTATFCKGVVIGVAKKGYMKVLQRSYSCKGVKRDLTFSQEWKLLESNLIKDVKKKKWPAVSSRANKLLRLLQAEICRLSLSSSDEMAMQLINIYSMNIVVRYLAINKVASQSWSTPGVGNSIISSNTNKIALLLQSKETKLNLLSNMKVKLIQIPKSNGSCRTLGIITILDRVLQTQLCLLLDPFYEAKYSEHMYGFRKGRNTRQAAGFLKAVLKKSDTNHAGLLLIDIEKCFDTISHQAILDYVIVPNKWKSLLIRWLKAIAVNENNSILLKLDKGIIQGSAIGPLIRNVIVNKALFETVSDSSKLVIFDNFKSNKLIYDTITGKNSYRKIYRNIIVYADDIVITTSNSDEIENILISVSKLFQKFGLKISKEKSQIINYSDNKRIKFKYLDFSFFYVPTKHIKKGGILTRSDDITNRKFSKTQNGTYLVYPSKEKFKEIKQKCKRLIRLLLHASLVEVLNKLNLVIRGFANYYAWSNSYNRLKTLDGLLFRYLKKYLIRKFRKRGVRRPVWVAQKFLICKTISNSTGRFSSPYNLKWHLHTKLLNTKDNNKCFKNVLFLVFPSKVTKILPINSAILPKELRIQPYYLAEEKFAENFAILYSKRVNTDNYKERLFIQQKGICPHCNLALANTDKDDFSLDIFGNDLEIHHKNEIAKMQKISKSVHKVANFFYDLVLLHKACHLEITLKSDSGKPSAERLAC